MRQEAAGMSSKCILHVTATVGNRFLEFNFQ